MDEQREAEPRLELAALCERVLREADSGRKAERRHHRFVARLGALQAVPGELNDIQTGRGLAERIAGDEPADEARDVPFAAGHATGEQDEREADPLRDALAAHATFSDAKPSGDPPDHPLRSVGA